MKTFPRLLAAILLVFAAGTAGSPAQDWAKAQLEKSPRHLEWIEVEHGTRKVKCFLAYPEAKEKASAVVIIHEIFGLTDWVRSVADQLAAAGYVAIAPDFLSGMAPDGVGGTSAIGTGDDVRKAIQSLPPDQVTADLDAAVAHAAGLPASNGKVVVAGFCWGGAQAFRFAAHNAAIKASHVFYGTGPDKAEIVNRIAAPVYGFYAENDARVNTTLPRTTELMQKAGKTFEPVTYAGAGHGFMRAGEAPDASEANRKAREDAWKRWKELLSGM